jgi:tetratricopeptide (TPR) repeat protein
MILLKAKRWMGVGAALLALVFYARTAGFDFVNYDDNLYVYENQHVTGGLTSENIRWAFEIHGPSMWVPLTWLSHQTVSTLFGMSPVAHHAINAVLHAANVWLLFLLLRRLTGRDSAALIGALLFAVHPIHVESVAWVTERKDVLSGFFCFLTLIFYDRYAREKRRADYLAVCAGTALAVMAKPLAVTLPCVLILLDFCHYRRRVNLRLFAEKIPLFLMVGFASVMTVLCQLSIQAIGSAESFPMVGRIANALTAYASYLIKLIVPAGLAVFYPYPEQTRWLLAAASALLLAGISALVFRKRKAAPWALTGWLWYLGMLFPMIGIVQAGAQAMADRYLYLPAVGLYWIAGMLLSETAFRRKAAAVMIVLLCVLNVRQVAVWENSRTLFAHALQVTQGNYLAHNNYGLTLREEGRLVVAREHFEQSLRCNPDYLEAINNLGITQAQLGDYAGAISNLTRVAVNGNVDALYNLGTALVHQGNFTAAEYWLRHAAASELTNAGVLYNLGFALQAQQRWQEAEAQYREVLRLQPDHADAQTNLDFVQVQRSEVWRFYEQGNQYRMNNQQALAEQAYRNALALQPRFAEAYNNLGVILGQQGHHEAALQCFNTAVSIAPDYDEAQMNARRAVQMLNQPLAEPVSGKSPDPVRMDSL